MYALFTDTDTDINLEEAKKYGYNLISMPYTIDGKEVKPYIDFTKFNDDEYYERLRKGSMPSTSTLSPVDYKNYFEPFFKKGMDILYVHFSSNMSGTFNSMRLGLEELKEQYPDRNVYLIDTKGITICAYAVVMEIGKMYKDGKSIKEIMAWADKEVSHFAVYFYADDLKFFHRSGRVSGLSTFFGNIIGIHPILYMDDNGTMQTFDKVRGKEQSFKKLLNKVVELEEDIDKHDVIVGYAGCIDLAKKLGEMVKEKFPTVNLVYKPVNPTAGAHCGPDTIGVCFHAKHK